MAGKLLIYRFCPRVLQEAQLSNQKIIVFQVKNFTKSAIMLLNHSSKNDPKKIRDRKEIGFLNSQII